VNQPTVSNAAIAQSNDAIAKAYVSPYTGETGKHASGLRIGL
jgi:hypothetical protein